MRGVAPLESAALSLVVVVPLPAKSAYPSVLFLLNYAQKRALLERHGYTVHDEDAESDLDFTLAEDVASGAITLVELDAAVGR